MRLPTNWLASAPKPRLAAFCSRSGKFAPPAQFVAARVLQIRHFELNIPSALDPNDLRRRMVRDDKTRARQKAQKTKEKKSRKVLATPDLKRFPQFSLCEALRILRAIEVGQDSDMVKYELFIRFFTYRDGPVVKSSIKLPHPLAIKERVAVICPEGSQVGKDALAAGAVMVGERTILDMIRAGNINFTRLVCHVDSESNFLKANLGRILGPKSLMPNRKNNTITSNVLKLMSSSAGTIDFRERLGVVRTVVGDLSQTPAQLADNIKAVMGVVKAQAKRIDSVGSVPKRLHEVVLSTTHGPGLSLNGKLSGSNVTVATISGPM